MVTSGRQPAPSSSPFLPKALMGHRTFFFQAGADHRHLLRRTVQHCPAGERKPCRMGLCIAQMQNGAGGKPVNCAADARRCKGSG
jgi:hypothetical protein